MVVMHDVIAGLEILKNSRCFAFAGSRRAMGAASAGEI